MALKQLYIEYPDNCNGNCETCRYSLGNGLPCYNATPHWWAGDEDTLHQYHKYGGGWVYHEPTPQEMCWAYEVEKNWFE